MLFDMYATYLIPKMIERGLVFWFKVDHGVDEIHSICPLDQVI
jgi:hypothetical protein